MYHMKHKLKTCAACNVKDPSYNPVFIVHRRSTAVTQHSICVLWGGHSDNSVLMVHCNSWGSLGEENLQNESVLWEVDAYKLAIKVHIFRKFMPINQFSLSMYWVVLQKVSQH